MKPYIVNLTNHLIASYGIDKVYDRNYAPDMRQVFISLVQAYIGDAVRTMNPSTLGKILGELEVGDVMAKKEELLQFIFFSGDCSDVLRELTATALAYVVYERLSPIAKETGFPPYRRAA